MFKRTGKKKKYINIECGMRGEGGGAVKVGKRSKVKVRLKLGVWSAEVPYLSQSGPNGQQISQIWDLLR